jgi:hypothetical protein
VLFVPLTVTFLGLATLRLGVRRMHRVANATEAPFDAVADAVRTAAIFAVGVAAVTAFGRWTLGSGGSGEFEEVRSATKFTSSPFQALFWALLAAFAVALLTDRPPAGPRWTEWLPSLRGAVVGLGTGIVASFGVALALAYAYAGRLDATPSDVTRLLPALAAYAVNLGTTFFGAAVGGKVGVPYGRGTATMLWSSGVPRGYLLLFVVPVVSVLTGAWSIVRRGDLPSAAAARACARMALPATLLWLVLDLVSMARAGVAGFVAAEAKAGAVLWDALLVGLWFAVLGWLAGWLLGRRNADGAAPAAPDGAAHEAAYDAAFDRVETTPVP